MPKEKVLVVEDENIVALDLKRRLQKLGYEVVGMASNSHRALSLVEEHRPDIVLMDIHIQGHTDGIEIAHVINQDFQIPVIFLTAYSEEATLARARESKPYGYLLKPYSERELHAGIQMALEKNLADRKVLDAQIHLQLALDAGKFTTWESGARPSDIVLSYTSSGQAPVVSDWALLSDQIVPEDRETLEEKLQALIAAPGLELETSFELLDPALGRRWLALYGKSHLNREGNRVVGVLQDITERKRVEENLKQAALVYRCSADGIVILDEQRRIISVNSAFSRITGYESESWQGHALPFLNENALGEHISRELEDNLRDHGFWQGEIKTFRVNHDVLYSWVNIGIIPDSIGELGHYVLVLSDITEIRNAQEKLSRIAYYDGLTNLPNRNLFMDRLEHAIAKAQRDGTELAILFLDLDHFKRVNDTLGHQVGDIMLKGVAQRLKSQIRGMDTLCRVGGDEFIVIVDRFKAREDLEIIAGKLLKSLNQPLHLGRTDVIPHASIGISLYPTDSGNMDDLIKMADTAMYYAKNMGRSRFAFYEPEMTAHTEHYLKRENELRLALVQQQLRMHYQPQYDAVTEKMVGLEALIRWQHPTLGLVAANEIIPVAESSDLIVAIGNWVMEEVCRQYGDWKQRGLEIGRIAINASPRQLQDDQFLAVLAAAMNAHAVEPRVIEIEITESCLQDNETIVNTLHRLEELGVTISIDDFGTGYSCLSSLKALPIHRLKIDQAFVRDIPEDESDCAIASAIVALGQQLKMSVIAEGIEVDEQALFMRNIGCDELQGYLYSRPVPPEEIEILLQADYHRNAKQLD